MKSFIETPWDTDINLAVRNAHVSRTDDDYYLATVELVEQGVSPIRQGQRLTMSDLREWEQRCRHQPMTTQEATGDADTQRIIQPQNALL